MATALTLVLMLGLGALFLSFTTQYSSEIFALLFGEILGISSSEILPVALLGAALRRGDRGRYRPLLLSSLAPESGEARGVRAGRIELLFLVVLAIATSMTLPVVGALLIFSLMIGPPAAARVADQQPAAGHGPVGGHRRRAGLGRRSRRLTRPTGRSASSWAWAARSVTRAAAAGPPVSAAPRPRRSPSDAAVAVAADAG